MKTRLQVLAVYCLVLLVPVSQVHGQSLGIADFIANVESASETLHIDAAVATLDGVCAVPDDIEMEGPGEAVNTPGRLRFHSASISKLFTAIAIMQLRDEGKLSLNDQVGEYVPAFGDSPIRIVHLLTHTSGLRDRQRADGRVTAAEAEQYIGSLAKQKIRKSPGTEWRYSDAGFNLLGRVIENVTGRPFAVAMKDRLLMPIGMQDSDFDLSRIPQQDRVVSYSQRGKVQDHPWDLAFLPSSGLQTTAYDLALFAQAVLRVPLGNSQLDLSLSSLLEMTKVQLNTEWTGVSQAYGWQVTDSPQGRLWRHAGGEAGFENLLTIYPDQGFAIAVMGNRKDWPRFELEREIRISILAMPGFCDK